MGKVVHVTGGPCVGSSAEIKGREGFGPLLQKRRCKDWGRRDILKLQVIREEEKQVY
jgi:hypothetical protein